MLESFYKNKNSTNSVWFAPETSFSLNSFWTETPSYYCEKIVINRHRYSRYKLDEKMVILTVNETINFIVERGGEKNIVLSEKGEEKKSR